MRELTHFETSQASGAGTKSDNAEVMQLRSLNKDSVLVNKLFRVLNGLFGMKIPYLK
ncbi:hypothetical protein [Pantoea agglomerans]|uniref:hypothetical protein n=1 Tax=Enterobacter agglomerans TaxID=549 RepID=UPI0013B5F576|nr:hypothetical protein [Pantoea agglomerans]NEG59388.1 hypothetical protein [Pantoea agglomerans]NEH00616.1 hypothetical protein [Pantoea agglomerans]NEH04683.1 hypothetical protein [Pantoea agglomerans]NEH16012.1 hypothetical protein [Pantoea agglomerans]